MRTPLALLQFLAKAVGNALGGGLAGDFLVEVLPEVATDVWQWWSKNRTAEQRRADIEALAQAGDEAVRHQVAALVPAALPDKPLAVRRAVQAYLTQVPASVRRSLRRPSDPGGTTVPAASVPARADDLLRLLPARPPRFQPGGHPLDGVDWELEELLGMGGFGEVWKARNPHLASAPPVALKFCLDPAAARVLRNEAALLDRLMRQGRHPGIVQLLRTYLRAETPCLEYEYVEGGDLTGWLHEGHRGSGGPTAHLAATVLLRLAETVGFAHRLSPPVVHRDLKPANILVRRTAQGETQFQVADFGIGGVAAGQALRAASRGTSRGQFLTSAVRGAYTPLYASPQQVRGEAPDPRDDVYALGVIWYQLLTGDLSTGRPGGSRWQHKLHDRGVPDAHIGLLASCFEEEAADRWPDAQALATELAKVAGPKVAPQPSLQPGPPRLPWGLARTAPEYSAEAEACRLRGDLDRALAEAGEALRLDPRQVRAHYCRAAVYLQRADYDRAIAEATRAAVLDPSYAQVYGIRAEAYRYQEDHGRALADATQALVLDPTYAFAYGTRAAVYLKQAAYDRAIADATQAVRLDPQHVLAFYARAEAYRCKNAYDRAIADASEALRLNPGYAFAYGTRAEAYRCQGDLARALADATEAVRLDPNHVLAYSCRAAVYLQSAEYGRAVGDASEAVRLDPGCTFAYGIRGCALRRRGEFAAAVADLSEALRRNPGDAWARGQLEMARRLQS
jgi:tetratricopeptide (TPR) repeat protein